MGPTTVLVVCWELGLLSLFAGSLTVLAPHALLSRSCAALTALVAVVSGPIMVRWAQPAFLALLVSHWDNAQGVLTDVGHHLRDLPPDATDLDALVGEVAAQVARRLRLPYVAIMVDDETVSSGGGPPPGVELVEIALAFVGEPVGTLLAAPRGRDRSLSVEDRALLDELAVHIGMTLHAARATRDLQDSRAALITAREEERRRIRRNLHDGLGPTLASLRLHLAAVEALIGTDPDRAAELVGRLRIEVAGIAGQVRSLVYGLRPPLLDELGLAQALRSQVAGVSGLEVTVAGAPATGTLPAAVEVALYRVASEAVANVVRHAGASRCEVSVAPVGDWIRLRVADDGRGLPRPWCRGWAWPPYGSGPRGWGPGRGRPHAGLVRRGHPPSTTPGGSPLVEELTSSERNVLRLLAQGADNQAIARELFISHKTVRNYVSSIFRELQVANRAEAIVAAREAGLHQLPPGERP